MKRRFAFLFLFLLSACSQPPDEQSVECDDDHVAECPCPGVNNGTQTCREGRYDACKCAGDTGSSPDAGYDDAATDTGTPDATDTGTTDTGANMDAAGDVASDTGDDTGSSDCAPDERNACGGCEVLANTPGAACDEPNDNEACTNDLYECVGPDEVACFSTGPLQEICCNGVDDDCDGTTDADDSDCGAAPGCTHAGDLRFETQDDLDAFVASGCTRVTGNVTIEMPNVRANVNELAPLTCVGGNFTIDNSTVASVALDGLLTVGGNLTVGSSTATESVSFPALETVGGEFRHMIAASNSHPALQWVGGHYLPTDLSFPATVEAPSLTAVHGNLVIDRCDNVANIPLDSLRYVGGTLNVGHCEALESLSGLDALEVVGGSVVIHDLATLTSFTLDGLRIVGGRLEAHTLPAVPTISGPSALLAARGGVLLFGWDGAASIEGFDSVKSLPNLTLNHNAVLETIDGFASLEAVAKLDLTQNPMLPFCEAYEFSQSLQTSEVALPPGDPDSCP